MNLPHQIAQWLLCVPPDLTLKNSTLLPCSVVWFSEQTVIISLYSIN